MYFGSVVIKIVGLEVYVGSFLNICNEFVCKQSSNLFYSSINKSLR